MFGSLSRIFHKVLNLLRFRATASQQLVKPIKDSLEAPPSVTFSGIAAVVPELDREQFITIDPSKTPRANPGAMLPECPRPEIPAVAQLSPEGDFFPDKPDPAFIPLTSLPIDEPALPERQDLHASSDDLPSNNNPDRSPDSEKHRYQVEKYRFNKKKRDLLRTNALNLLNNSPEAFIKWREHDHQTIWLAKANLASLDLRGIQWKGCVLTGASFERSDLRDSDFRGAILHAGVTFKDALLQGAIFDEYELSNPWMRPKIDVELVLTGKPRWYKRNLTIKAFAANRSSFSAYCSMWISDGQVKEELLTNLTLPPFSQQPISIKATQITKGLGFRIGALIQGEANGRPQDFKEFAWQY